MNEQKAKEILGARVQTDGSLSDMTNYVSWSPGDTSIVLDANFTAEELEAIAWWIINKK